MAVLLQEGAEFGDGRPGEGGVVDVMGRRSRRRRSVCRTVPSSAANSAASASGSWNGIPGASSAETPPAGSRKRTGPSRVWAVARDFNGHAAWHPLIADSHIDDGLASDVVGCVRNFTLVNGAHLRERLLALSDIDHSFTYSILESPMPIRDYHASFGLKPVTEGGKTFVEWSARFDVAPEDEARIVEQVGRATFAEGISALDSYVRAQQAR